LFADILKAPAVQSLARRLEKGGVLACAGVSQAAQPFFAALLQNLFPQRPVVIVTDNLKTQESFQQDLETWLSLESTVHSPQSTAGEVSYSIPHSLARRSKAETAPSSPLFYPAWDVLPHEGKLPHADTISDRLQTLVTLSTLNPMARRSGAEAAQLSTLIVTSVTALLQKTFPPGELQKRTRALACGDKINPLDLIEWLEEQGCEPEAQVTQKGEIALRGGILDVWPLTSPWPVRLEFFGDELESLRHFDPLTQISREEILSVTLPPAGELGLLKREAERGVHAASMPAEEEATELFSPHNNLAAKRPQGRAPLATLSDYLPPETIFLLCEPEQLAACADEYARQIPDNDPFFIPWTDFLIELSRRGFASVEVEEETQIQTGWGERPREPHRWVRPRLARTLAPPQSAATKARFMESLAPPEPIYGMGSKLCRPKESGRCRPDQSGISRTRR
jgi:transcription-repair coupling factor (superfamily II helicase)